MSVLLHGGIRAGPHAQYDKTWNIGTLTVLTGIVTAAAPACAHAAACITPETEVKLTLIPCSHCRPAAASMPAFVAGIY